MMLAEGQQLSAVVCLAHRAGKDSEALLGSLGLLGGAARPRRKAGNCNTQALTCYPWPADCGIHTNIHLNTQEGTFCPSNGAPEPGRTGSSCMALDHALCGEGNSLLPLPRHVRRGLPQNHKLQEELRI